MGDAFLIAFASAVQAVSCAKAYGIASVLNYVYGFADWKAR